MDHGEAFCNLKITDQNVPQLLNYVFQGCKFVDTTWKSAHFVPHVWIHWQRKMSFEIETTFKPSFWVFLKLTHQFIQAFQEINKKSLS